jgi:Zn-dependent protease
MVSPADVEAELLKPERAKATALQNTLLLLGSVAVYAASGALRWSWSYVAILVVVLLIHEAGHWVAMRCFGYSDLQMFFIPFFGAAVSGKPRNTSSSRKAVVALLGPAPGILLGIGSGILFLKVGHPVLLSYATTSVFLNGLNLLPIYPLDGGRYMETVVFSRHPAVEIVFKILAACALVVLAVWLKSIAFGILAFFTLILTREAFYQNRVVRHLREIAGAPVAPPAEHIPAEYVEAVFPELTAGFSAHQQKAKTLAARADAAWRKFAEVRPRLGATFALLAAYVGVAAVAIGGSVYVLAAVRHRTERTVLVREETLSGGSILLEQRFYLQHKLAENQVGSDGLYDGRAATWHVKGQLQSTGTWRTGFQQGEWKFFDPQGNITFVTTYEAGRPVRYQVGKDGTLVTVPPDDWPFPVKYSVQRKPRGTTVPGFLPNGPTPAATGP